MTGWTCLVRDCARSDPGQGLQQSHERCLVILDKALLRRLDALVH